MGRWRAPGTPAAPYITAAGYRALESEVQELWARRRAVVVHLAAAAAEGDRSENAEYQYRKRELAGIDRRIRYLERRMPVLEVVAARPPERGKVYFGAVVELEDAAGATRSLRIVGADEAVPERGTISLDSPVARRLLGRGLDDEIVIEGQGVFSICAIDYPDPCA